LDTDSLPFGAVVEGSQNVKKLSLDNSGDLPITFQWVESTFGPHFSISPRSGKLTPGSEIIFDVIFKPTHLDEDISQDNIMLNIHGLSPLVLTCTGMCIRQPSDSAQVLQFNSLVRKEEKRPIRIDNPTDKDWFLSPSLQSDHWHVPYEVKVPAKSFADLIVTYLPLSMCPAPLSATPAGVGSKGASGKGRPPSAKYDVHVSDEEQPAKQHKGELFVALPDGTAQLYHLKGYADKPECFSEIILESSAKKAVATTIQLNNWLGVMQKFNVTVDLSEKPSPATFVITADVVETGPNSTKEFPVRFISYVEGITKGTITFTNKATGEYLFYAFRVKTLASEVLETLEIESPMRQTARYVITVENPLPADVLVTMGSLAKPMEWWTCDSKYVNIVELAPMSGNREASYEIQYRPLLLSPQPVEALLTVISKDLGAFKYKLLLTTSPPVMRQTLRFEVPLGAIQAESFMFKAYNTVKCDFNCLIKQSDIFVLQKVLPVEACVNGWEGDDVRLSVSFEPIEIGVVRDTLTVTSATWGEYQCDLIATCTPPLPQGPFNFNRSGSSSGGETQNIPFRNCFNTSCTWNYSVDSPAFRLQSTQATVGAKSQGQCPVIFDPQGDYLNTIGGVISAKLFITCTSKPDMPPWVFYLRGIVGSDHENVITKGKK
jgi:hydrocephalus-inducing protein